MSWNIAYQIFGITLLVVLIIAIYKIYIESNQDKFGIARSQ